MKKRMVKVVYTEISEKDLDMISPLWKKLRQHHIDRSSPYFAGQLEKMTFKLRKKILLEKAGNGAIYIDLARDKSGNTVTGYCVTTVNDKKVGEIESIYVEEKYRRHGIGDNLMKRALLWLEGHGATRIILGVAAGNEEVFPFYRRYGFYPRATILEQVEKKAAHQI
jgi:ribosomal protein S18 acetylase RimI-like enzyme